MDKKTKKIIILIALVIIVLILIEVIIRLAVSTTKEIIDNHNLKVAREKYEETEEYEEEIYLEDCIEETIALMKSGDYETLYSLIDPVYKEYMNFANVNVFKEYMENYLGKYNSIDLIEYKESYGKYVCTFKLENDVGSTTKKVLIEEQDEYVDSYYNFNIIFDEIYYIESYGTTHAQMVNDIKYQVAYRIKYSDYSAYIIKVTNKKKNAINLSMADTYICKTNKEKYYSYDTNILSNLNIGAGETKLITFKVNDKSSYMYEESYIGINPVINGKSTSQPIIITMARDYYE